MPQLIDDLSQPDTHQLIDILIVTKYLGNKVMKTEEKKLCYSSFRKIFLQHCHSLMIMDSAFSYKIDYVTTF